MTMTSASSEYFSRVAGQWDQLRSGYFPEAVREAAIQKAYLRKDMIVADVGAGTGFVAAGLAPLVSKVYVLDGSPAMLDIARQNLARFSNVEYSLADGGSLGLPGSSLDAVFANMYLHHCPDPLASIREMVRLLKPGGRLVITDADAHNHAWMREEMADVWLGFERDQVRAWFQESGLVNVIVDCTGQNCCAQSANPDAGADAGQAAISVFVAVGARRLAMREQVQAAYSEAAQSGCGCGSPASEAAQAACCGGAETVSQSSCCSTSQSSGSACCAPDEQPAASAMYSAEELAAIPREAGEISLGCGNPIALAGLRPGETVLDIGSGGGIDAFLAAGKVGPQGRVIGVDMTPAMLARARASAQKAGISNVEFRQGQAEALPVEDGQVDVILSNCVINLCEDKGQVFREAFRALKPGGRLEVSDIVTRGTFLSVERQDEESWAACVSGALPEQEYLDLIAQAGFETPQVRRSRAVGEEGGVQVYSAIVSARKPDSTGSQAAAGCGCS